MALRHAIINQIRQKAHTDIRAAIRSSRVDLMHLSGVDQHHIAGGKFVVGSVQINQKTAGECVKQFDIIMIMSRKNGSCFFCYFYMTQILAWNAVNISVLFFGIIHK